MATRILNTIWVRSSNPATIDVARKSILMRATRERHDAVGADKKTGEVVALDLVVACPHQLDAGVISYPLETLYSALANGAPETELAEVATVHLQQFNAFPDHWIVAELERHGLPLTGPGLLQWTREHCSKRETAIKDILRRRRLATTFGYDNAGDWMRANWGSSSIAFETAIQVDNPGCLVVNFLTKSNPPEEWFRRLRAQLGEGRGLEMGLNYVVLE